MDRNSWHRLILLLLGMLLLATGCQSMRAKPLAKPDFVWDPYDFSSGESSMERVAILPIDIEIDRSGCQNWREGSLAITRKFSSADGKLVADPEFTFQFNEKSKVVHLQYWTEVGIRNPSHLAICPQPNTGLDLQTKDCFQDLKLPQKLVRGINPLNSIRVTIPDCRFMVVK